MTYNPARSCYNIAIPDNMEPGQTLVVPGLGRLTLAYGQKENLCLKAASVICHKNKIICFKPTEKSIRDAKACNRCHVTHLLIIDPSGRFTGNCAIDAVEYTEKLDTLIITERPYEGL